MQQHYYVAMHYLKPQVIRDSRMIKVGDVFSIQTAKGKAYFQYTAKNKLMGPLIRVLPGIYMVELTRQELDILTERHTNFWVFFHISAAVKIGSVTKVGNFTVPEHSRSFPLFRSGPPDKNGHVPNWWLWDGEKSWMIGELTSDQRKLPIRGAWNDTLLISRIEQGWLPEKDTR